MEEIRNPPRLDSLNPFTVQIIQHISNTKTTKLEFTDVFPFETLFNVKQRITLAHSSNVDAKHWLPSQVFLAEEKEGKFVPLEFEWGFQKDFTDPYDPAVLGKPVRELFVNGERVPITPTLFSGILLETRTNVKTIHAWNMYDIAIATGFRPKDDISDEVLFGFLHLYFPMIHSKEEFSQIDNPIDPEVLEIVKNHRTFVSERYKKLEHILQSDESKHQPILSELLDLHYILPKKRGYKSGFLEMRFYEMEPTEFAPFIRFFPANVREMPIVKLASKKGFSAIENKKLLNKLLDDQPSIKLGSVILIKSPIFHPDAPLGTTWTIRIYEDGNAELVIGAPRKNQPLLAPVLAEAFKILPSLLGHIPWLQTSDLQLSQISAVYKFKTTIEGKPSREELKQRLDPFLPVFFQERGIDPTAQLSLRYKAVSNYVRDTDPIMDYIANLYLRDSATSSDPKLFQSYVVELIKEFGISKQEATKEVDAWVSNHSEQMLVGSKTVLERNVGSAISIYNDHPNYRFLLTGVGSFIDLRRILCLLTILVSNTHETLQVAETKQEVKEAQKVIEEVEAETSSQVEEKEKEEEGEEGWSFSMAARLPHENDEEEEDEEEEEETVAEEEKKLAKEEVQPNKKEPKYTETLPALSDEWYLDNLKEKNASLFSYTDSPKPYSRICQASSGKQPNVMDFATYQRAKLFYKSDVFWITSPLTQHQSFLLQFVSKTVSERMKMGKTVFGSGKEELMIKAEKEALRLGFPMKKDESVVDTIKGVNPDDAKEIKDLITQQQTKPLWTVVRAGTEKPNYYICAELWCIRDNLPIIPWEFEGNVSRRKDEKGEPLKKPNNSCPICIGTIIKDHSNPQPGETIVQRKKAESSKIQKYAGFAKVVHPSGFALPCCFTDPNNQDLSEDAKPPPEDLEIPEQAEVKEPQVVMKKTAVTEKENRNRPFSPYRKGLSSQNEWYIPNQNILGRIVDRWLFLDKGSVAVPSKAVNSILGQDPEKFLTKKGGILQGSINSQLTVPGNAFVQYGLGNSVRQPGSNLLSFLAYAHYAAKHSFLPDDSLAIESNESMVSMLFEEKAREMFFAFQSANYGTLVHEFSAQEKSIKTVEQKRAQLNRKPATFQEWFGSVAYTPPSKELDAKQRAYYENLFLSWDNFEDYVRDTSAAKNLSVWEGLFTVKGLITDTGFILVKIIVPKNPNDEARIECPMFGVPLVNQKEKLPLLFVLQDSVTGLYDPLVLYEGKIVKKESGTKEVKILLGVISENFPIFANDVSPNIREPIKTFLSQYYGEGCGRKTSPIHPWLPAPISTLPQIPRLSEYVSILERNKKLAESEEEKEKQKEEKLFTELRALVKDRSHRLIGVLVQYIPKPSKESGPFFIPCLDDGLVLTDLPSVYGEESLPFPSFTDYCDFLTGRNKHDDSWSKHKWATYFKGLDYRNLVTNAGYYVGVDLACGITVPIKPMHQSVNIKEIIDKYFSSDSKRAAKRFKETEVLASMHPDMPWETDVGILGPANPEAKSPGQTDEEVLEESYQHLRITISNWLNDDVKGRMIRKKIEELRQARKRIPLYELQKRLEILLMPEVKKYITTKGKSGNFLLRKDCSKTDKKDCIGGCVWVGDEDGECLIHTTKTERFQDPLYVLTVRLVDELLRTFGSAAEVMDQHVSYLKPLTKDQLQQEGDTLLFSVFGKGDESLYDKLGFSRRRPGKFTQALTYPEEVSIDEITVSSKYIPDDWGFSVPIFGADIRGEYARFVAILTQMTGKPIDAIEKEIGKITNTEENWKAIATMLNANIVFTKLHISMLEPQKVFDVGSKMYVVLSEKQVPLKHNAGKYIVEKSQLPKSIQSWLSGEEIAEEEKEPKEKPIAKGEKAQKPPKPPVKENREELAESTLTFSLENCRTIDTLNILIETIYREQLGDENKMTLKTGENLKDKKFDYTQYYMMDSSAFNFDCLIHTLLTAVSRNFRCLPKQRKNEFANYFRKTIYPEILDSLGVTDELKRIILGRVSRKAFLLDEDIAKISAFYRINVLVFEDTKTEQITGYHDGPRIKTKGVVMPRCVTLHQNNVESAETYMIYNNGSHFEALRDATGYVITSELAASMYAKHKCERGTQVVQCDYAEGDAVMYKGSQHYVIWRISKEDGSCEKYGLTDSKEKLQEFLELDYKIRNKKATLETYGNIEVLAKDL